MKRFCIAPIALIFTLILLVGGCGASQPKVYHVGLLSGTKSFDAAFEGFKAEMTRLGYKEGENIRYDYQLTDGDVGKIKEGSQRFVTNKVDLIVATGGGAAVAAKEATVETKIPVVVLMVVDPVELNIVADVQRPGGNVTGVQTQASVFLSKLPELAKEMAPQVKRYWVPYDPDYNFSPGMLNAFNIGAKNAAVELVLFEIHSAADVVAELKRLETAADIGFEGIILTYNLIIRQAEAEDAIIAFAKARKMPVVGNWEGAVKKGALFLYLTDIYKNGGVGAGLADKIFKGANPGDLPILTDEVALTINYKAAQELGLTIPDYLLEQADEVIR